MAYAQRALTSRFSLWAWYGARTTSWIHARRFL